MSKLKNRWKRLRPALFVLLVATGAGAPLATAILGAGDVAVDITEEYSKRDINDRD